MKILVTGGAGFIGSHLLPQLLADGYEVTVLDNASSGNWENVPAECEHWEMDIRSEAVIPKIIKARFTVIVHLAAQTMVSSSQDDPQLDAAENIMGTVNILEAARLSDVDRIILSSTAAAYGDVPVNDLPIKESEMVKPLSFYGLSKVTAEQYIRQYQKSFGLNYVIFRFANVYGERQGDAGEGGVISIFAKKIAKGEGITIFGDGKQTRDFVYAGDIAAGIRAAITTDNVNDTYNLSTQQETSLLELVAIMSDIKGRKISPSFGAARTGDILRSSLSNKKAITKLGWKPKLSLKDGLKQTMNYVKKEYKQ